MKDFKTDEPLAAVTVRIRESNLGTSTDQNGRFQIPLSHKHGHLVFSSIGFESRTFAIKNLKSPIEVFLIERTVDLKEMIIKPEENPAWAIIRKVQKNEPENNPLKYRAFQADFYAKNKFGMNIIEIIDSSNAHIPEFIKRRIKPKEKPTPRLDSIPRREYLNLLILENSGRFYVKKGQQKEVIENTVSNLPKFIPVNSLFNSTLNPLGFYDEYYRFNIDEDDEQSQVANFTKNYVSPLHSNTFKIYDLELLDTLISTRGDSLFVIAFQPLSNKSKDALKGQMKISSKGYAIQSIRAKNADSLQTFNLNLAQEYAQVKEKWYPVNRTVDLSYLSKSTKGTVEITLTMEHRLSHIDAQLDKNIYFDGASRMVTLKADTISQKGFAAFRPFPLDSTEQLTYQRWESPPKMLGKVKKLADLLEKPLKIINQAAAPFGPFILIFDQIGFNRYELARLGIGIQNNLFEYPRFGFRASVGYGLRDKMIKYSGSASYFITKNRYNRLEVYQNQDITPPGTVEKLGPNYTQPPLKKLSFNRNGYYVDRFQKSGFAFYTKPLPWTWLRLNLEKEKRESINYMQDQNAQHYTHFSLKGRFVPREQFIRTQFLEKVVSNYYPIIHFGYRYSTDNQSKKTFWASDFDIKQQIRWKKIGYDLISFSAGYTSINTPYSFLFNNLGNTRGFFGIDKGGFVTGDPRDFAYNRFIEFNFTHYFGKNLIKSNNWRFQPQVAIGHRFSWSMLDSKGNTLPGLNDFSKGNYEVDLYLISLFRVRVLGVVWGLGLNGAYNYTPDFIGSNRFAIRPTISSVVF